MPDRHWYPCYTTFTVCVKGLPRVVTRYTLGCESYSWQPQIGGAVVAKLLAQFNGSQCLPRHQLNQRVLFVNSALFFWMVDKYNLIKDWATDSNFDPYQWDKRPSTNPCPSICASSNWESQQLESLMLSLNFCDKDYRVTPYFSTQEIRKTKKIKERDHVSL